MNFRTPRRALFRQRIDIYTRTQTTRSNSPASCLVRLISFRFDSRAATTQQHPNKTTSAEDYEGDYGYADGSGSKRFSRRVVKAGGPGGPGGPGRGSPTLPPGPGGEFSGLSFVFAGEGKGDGGTAVGGGGGARRVRGTREAMHVSGLLGLCGDVILTGVQEKTVLAFKKYSSL